MSSPGKGFIPFLRKHSFLLYFLIAQLLFLPSIYIEILRVLRAPSWTIFPLIHTDFAYDYHVYLSAITLGKDGYWLFRNPFTAEPAPAQIFYIFYILIGKMAAVMHLWVPYAYHFAKFFAVELFIVASYFVSAAVVGTSLAFWAGFFSLFATIAPVSLFGDPPAYITYTPWWNFLDSWTRLDNIPHYVMAQALSLITVLFIFFFVKNRHWGYIFAASLLSVAAGIMLPTSIFPILFGFPVSIGILLVRNALPGRKTDISAGFIIALAVVCIVTSAALGLIWLQTNSDPVWLAYKVWEVNQWNSDAHFLRSFILGFGILPVFAVSGLLWSLFRGRWQHIFIAVWALLPFALLPFINMLGMGKIRVIYQAPYVPLGILASLSLFYLAPRSRIQKMLWTWGGVLIFLVITVPVTIQVYAYHMHTAVTEYFWYNEFIPKNVFKGIEFMNRSVPRDSVFVSDIALGNVIPAYAPVRSYVGHIGQTLDYFPKLKQVEQFYTGAMGREKAFAFLKRNAISYVLVGLTEKRWHLPAYTFLKPIYENPDITIYEVSRMNE